MEVEKKIGIIQSKMIAIKETGKNPFLKNTYSLYVQDIMTALQPHLTEHNLTVHFKGFVCEHSFKQHLMLVVTDNDSNTYVNSEWVIPDNTDVQKLGSYITYLKRYSLVAMFNLLVGHDDNDGQVFKSKATVTKKSEGVTDEQLQEAISMIKSGSITKETLLTLKGHKLSDSQRKKIESL